MNYEEIADAIIAKKPELKDIHAQIIEEIEMLESMADDLISQSEALRETIPDMLDDVSDPDEQIKEETDSAFGLWDISAEKLSQFFGFNVDGVYKFMALTLESQGDTTPDKEAMKTYIIANLRPAFDVLAI